MEIYAQLKELSLFLTLKEKRKKRSTMPDKPDKDFNNVEIIAGIKKGDSRVFHFLREKTFPFIVSFTGRKNGSKELAEEIFQDALIVIFKKLKKGDLSLSCQFVTYFNSICKYIWRFEQKLRNNPVLVPVDEVNNYFDEHEIEDLYKESKEFELYRVHFKKLKKRQQKILKASMLDEKYKDVYTNFGYNSVDSFKNEVYRIKKQLITQIKSDPRFKNYHGNSNWSL